MSSPLTLFCRGVPVRHHLYSDVRAKTALAVEVERSLMKWASSRIMRCHEICNFRKSRGRGPGLGRKMEASGACCARSNEKRPRKARGKRLQTPRVASPFVGP